MRNGYHELCEEHNANGVKSHRKLHENIYIIRIIRD